MSCHRILIVGAPASGKHWLAERIRSLTGIALLGPAALAGEPPAETHEWIALVEEPGQVARLLPACDLVVVVSAPLWLRDLRLLRRWLGPRRGAQPREPLRAGLARSHAWNRRDLLALRDLLRAHEREAMPCRSSDEVRAVLERIFGIEAGADAPWAAPGT